MPCAYHHYENVPHGFVTFEFLPQAKAAFESIAQDLAHVLEPGKFFGDAPTLGSIAVTPYGSGVVTSVAPNAVKVSLEWDLPVGVTAVAQVSSATLRYCFLTCVSCFC